MRSLTDVDCCLSLFLFCMCHSFFPFGIHLSSFAPVNSTKEKEAPNCMVTYTNGLGHDLVEPSFCSVIETPKRHQAFYDSGDWSPTPEFSALPFLNLKSQNPKVIYHRMNCINMASPPTAAQEAIAQALANDCPTIDSAVKSFVSLAAARVMGDASVTVVTMTTTTTLQSTNPDALKQARFLLKAINNYTFPLKRDPSEEYKTVAQIWNGLIASQQKPSRYLGRMALVHAWNNGLPDEIDEEGREFSNEFGSLLLQYKSSTEIPEEDCDACLLWDEDKGQAELAWRRQRRAERAREQQERQQQTTIPMIEELPDDDNE